MKKFFMFLFLLSILTFTSVKAAEISNCSTLDKEGETYYLVADIVDSSTSVCMNIKSNNIVLDCQGHLIDGIKNNFAHGIQVVGYSNITIKNCFVRDWSSGIYLEFVNYVSVFNNILESNEVGLYLYQTQIDVKIENNNITQNNVNIVMTQCCGLKLSKNIIDKANVCGIEVAFINCYDGGLNQSLIYNNFFNNSVNFHFNDAEYSDTQWNTTRERGESICLKKGEIGGNYWASSSGSGYSDTCKGDEENKFCAEPYSLAENNIDYLPYTGECELSPVVPTSTTTSPTTTTSTTTQPSFGLVRRKTTTQLEETITTQAEEASTEETTTTTLPAQELTPQEATPLQEISKQTTTTPPILGNVITGFVSTVANDIVYQVLTILFLTTFISLLILNIVFRRQKFRQQ